MRRVYITGIGVCSGVGHGSSAFFDGCLAGAAAVEPVPASWGAFYQPQSRHWSRLPAPDLLAAGLRKLDLLLLGKPAQLGVVCAHQALTEAGFLPAAPSRAFPQTDVPAERVGVYVGTGLGAAQAPFDNYFAHAVAPLKPALVSLGLDPVNEGSVSEVLAQLGRHPRVNPMVICQTMPNAIAANIAIRAGAQGPCKTATAACASGTVAIGEAFKAVQRGEIDVALAGGVEHLGDATGAVFMGFDRLQTLARPRTPPGSENRPFDAERSGFLFSEGGGAVLVLESQTSMARRGASPIAEIVGYAETCDAHSVAAISSEHNAIEAMLRLALHDAGIPASAIDYINAHGTGTEVNDRIEAELIARHFPHRPWVNSTKSILGHTIGAAGALECAATALSLKHQRLHACVNLENPIADLAFCTLSGPAHLQYAISQSFGFGGHNAALVLRCPP